MRERKKDRIALTASDGMSWERRQRNERMLMKTKAPNDLRPITEIRLYVSSGYI